jgi:hypothetical protein
VLTAVELISSDRSSPPSQILASETFSALLLRDMAFAVKNQIDAVRRIESYRHARAIVVCETNMSHIADQLKYQLQVDVDIRNMQFLHLDPIASRKRMLDGSEANAETGEMNPGLRTSPQNKPAMMHHLDTALREGRIHRLEDIITYATRNHEHEQDLAEEMTDVTTAPPNLASLDHLMPHFLADARERLIGQWCAQLKGMMRIEHRRPTRLGDIHLSYTFTGKTGYDPQTRQPRKDDLVLSLCVVMFGAFLFYTLPQLAGLRQEIDI